MIDELFTHTPRQRQETMQKILYGDPLFRVLYLPLWYQSKEDLSPVETWQEALMVIDEMKAIDSGIRHLEVARLIEQLQQRYSCFDNMERKEELAAHSSMLVMATVMFMLGEASEEWKDNPHRKLCYNISGVLSRIGGFKELCNDVRDSEHRTVDEEGPLPIRDFLKPEKNAIDESQLRNFTDEEIHKSGIRCNNPLAVLQAIDLMVQHLENDNDWISIYAVLVERDYISRTMTTFCTMVNSFFSASLSSNYMSKVLKSHGESIEKWKPFYDDQRRHLDLVSLFRKKLLKMGMA